MTTPLITAIAKIAGQGLLGVLLVIVGYGYYAKDKKNGELHKRIEALQENRLQDIISWKDETLRITNKVNEVIDTLTNLVKKGGVK